jgi:hypothetical protein
MSERTPSNPNPPVSVANIRNQITKKYVSTLGTLTGALLNEPVEELIVITNNVAGAPSYRQPDTGVAVVLGTGVLSPYVNGKVVLQTEYTLAVTDAAGGISIPGGSLPAKYNSAIFRNVGLKLAHYDSDGDVPTVDSSKLDPANGGSDPGTVILQDQQISLAKFKCLTAADTTNVDVQFEYRLPVWA